MTYEYLITLKNNHTALQILNADNFAMIVSFFDYLIMLSNQTKLKHSKSRRLYPNLMIISMPSIRALMSQNFQKQPNLISMILQTKRATI